jgi:putative FmdB family regulatory protein
VATYQYRCVRDGDFDVRRPIGTASPKSSCPVCDDDAVRVFRAPMLSLASRALMTAIDRTERTRDVPEVVSALPSQAVRNRKQATAQNPAWQHLPKP